MDHSQFCDALLKFFRVAGKRRTRKIIEVSYFFKLKIKKNMSGMDKTSFLGKGVSTGYPTETDPLDALATPWIFNLTSWILNSASLNCIYF